jgi:hypothetical protein
VATTTPRIDGRSLPTNLLEAAFVAVAGRFPLSDADLAAMVAEAGLAPDVWRPDPPGAPRVRRVPAPAAPSELGA